MLLPRQRLSRFRHRFKVCSLSVPKHLHGRSPSSVYDWIIRGRFVERLPGRSVRWPAVVPEKRPGPLTFVASTDRLPIRGELRLYRTLGPTGAPVDEPAVYRCTRAGAPGTQAASCLMSRQRVGRTARLLVRASPSLHPGVYALVLYLSWYVPTASRSGAASLPAAVAASWGFRISLGAGGERIE